MVLRRYPSFPRIHPRVSALRFVTAFLAGLCAALPWGSFFLPSHVSAQTLLLDNTFMTSSAPGWVFSGQASLTSGMVDPNGNGWLRLTTAANKQFGFAYLDRAIPVQYGIDIKVQFQTWGGSGADGFALDLFDGSVTSPTAGSSGGSLGYAQSTYGGNEPGLTGGLVGLGVDEFGNFSNASENRQGGPGKEPNSVAVRGPGDGTANARNALGVQNYKYLVGAESPILIQTGLNSPSARPTGASNLRYAEFIIGTNTISEGSVPVTVILSDGSGDQATVINHYQIYNALESFYGGASEIPSTFKVGFTSSTGGSTNFHEVRNLEITTLADLPPTGAAVFTYPGPGPWETASDWQGDHLPLSTDDTYVDNGGTAGLTSVTAVRSLNVGTGAEDSGTVTIGTGGSLTVATDTGVGEHGSGTLTLTGGGNLADQNGILGQSGGSTGIGSVSGTGSSWANSGNLYVGEGGLGTLNVSDGGSVYNVCAFVGDQAGSNGTVTVGGPGSPSVWTNSGGISVGVDGSGSVNVLPGGLVTSHDTEDCLGLDLGVKSDGKGTATVSGTGAAIQTDTIVAGDAGEGSLSLASGGKVTSSTTVTVGNQTGSNGSLTVDGTGSALMVAGNLTVGNAGTGNLTLSNRGSVSDAAGDVGQAAGSSGNVGVSGAGTLWANTGDLTVGDAGTGVMAVADGGKVTNQCAVIGNQTGSEGTVSVGGSGNLARWDNTGGIAVGKSGTGTLTVYPQGAVTSHDTEDCLGLDIAVNPGGSGSVAVNGPSASITTDTIVVGNGGVGSLSLSGGGVVNGSTTLTVGSQAGSKGTLSADGTGTSLGVAGDLTVGNLGTGSFFLTGGATAADQNAFVGSGAGSSGTVAVSGQGTGWTNRADLHVGGAGTGSLSIDQGALVSDQNAYLGDAAGSKGSILLGSSNTPATWNNAGGIQVGGFGSGVLSVASGSAVTSHDASGVPGLYLGADAGGSGTVNVTGPGSSIATDTTVIGGAGSGALTVSDGGTVTGNQVLLLGLQTGSTGNLTVDGAGSSFSTPADIEAGVGGSGSVLVSGGGQLSGANGYIADGGGSSGTASVAGSGSVLGLSSNLYVGQGGVGTLTVDDGGQVSNACAFIGNLAGSNGTVTVGVEGNPASWINAGGVAVGVDGTGTLNVANGGLVVSHDTADCLGLDVGVNPGGSGSVFLNGAGSSFKTDTVVVGNAGAGSLTLTQGASLTGTTTLTVGNATGSQGAVSLDGGSSVTVAGDATVGNAGAGSLALNGTSTLSNANGWIARQPGSSGTVTVAGESTWNNAGDLFVGAGGTGVLNIASSGSVSNQNAWVGSGAGSNGTVNVGVDGAPGIWANAGALQVGINGPGAVNVAFGSSVSSQDVTGEVPLAGLDVGVGSKGIVNVDGTDSTIKTGTVVVGDGAAGALNVTDGGSVTGASTLTVGNQAQGQGLLGVSGIGSSVSVPGTLYLGYSGNGVLAVDSWGTVTDGAGYLAYQPGSQATATVDGMGSQWAHAGDLYVGEGGSASLTIQNGGAVSNQCSIIGDQSGAAGAVNVTSGASWLNQGGITVGKNGEGLLAVASGGTVTSQDTPDCLGLDVAQGPNSKGMVAVDGAGSTLSTQTIIVGDGGTGALMASSGGTVTGTTDVIAGRFAGASGSVSVDGEGSALSTPADLIVGQAGAGVLSVTNGGMVNNAVGRVAAATGSSGAVTVDGAGSTWNNAGDLFVGDAGAGTLSITNHGAVLNECSFLGNQAGSTGSVTVSSVADWTNHGGISVGVDGTGTLLVNSGGTVKSADTPDCSGLQVGVNPGGAGSVTIEGAGSSVTTETVLVGNAGKGSLTVANGGQLNDQDATLGALAGSSGTAVISGQGSLWKSTRHLLVGSAGTGDLTLAQGGTVEADQGVIINPTGTVRGVGTIQAPLVSNAGLVDLNPVFGPGGLTVVGNYSQAPSGNLLVHINSQSSYGRLNVTGSATFDGTLTLRSDTHYVPVSGDTFAVVNAGGGTSGDFARVASSISSPGLVQVAFSATNGFLVSYLPVPASVLPVAPGQPTTSPGQPANPGQTTSLIPVVSLSNPIPIGQASASVLLLSLLDPAVASYSSLFEAGFSGANLIRENVENRLDSGRDADEENQTAPGGTPQATPLRADGKSLVSGKEVVGEAAPTPSVRERHWDVWATGFGDFVSVDADTFARGYDFTSGGVTLGVDYRLNDQWTVGLLGSYDHTWTDAGSEASLEVDTGRLGVYAGFHNRWFYVDAGGFVGYSGIDTWRQSFLGHARGSTNAEEYSLFLDAGHDFRFGNLLVGPVASIQYTSYHLDGFSEDGSILPVQIHGDAEDSLRTDLGVRAAYAVHVGKVAITPQVKAVWEHEYKYSALPLTAGYQGLQVAPGTFYGPRLGHDSALVSAGVNVQLTRAVSTYVTYEGQLGRDRYNANGVTGGLRVEF